MNTHPFAHKHAGLRAIILLTLVMAVLPAREVSAAEQEVVIPKATVDASVWKVNWLTQFSGVTGQEQLIFDEFLIQLYTRTPALSAGSAVATITELRSKYDAAVSRGQDASYRDLKTYDEIVDTAFDVASTMPALTPVARATWAVLVDQSITPQLDSATTIVALTRRYELTQSELQRRDTILQATLDLAQTNAAFADAYDQLSSAALHTSVKHFDAATFIAGNPAVAANIPGRIKNNIQPNGTVTISLQELEDLTRAQFDKINHTLTDLSVMAQLIDEDQNTLANYIYDKGKREKDEALAKAAADKAQLVFDSAKSYVSIVTDFMSLIDAKAGRYFSTINTAAIKIGESIEKWVTATAKLSTLGAIGSISTIIMTGNIVSAVMSVVSMFSDSGSSLDQQILEQIGKLRQQIDDLHRDMLAHFDRIDKELNALYTAMQDRFNLIDLQLGKLNGNVQSIQRELIGIELSLSRIERNNYQFLDAGFRRPLLDAINGAIGYRTRTGATMPYTPDFVTNENVFQTWGTVHAFDALSAGPAQRDYNDGQVLAELNAYPLDANINYLNGWLMAHGLAPFANDRLASPRDWTFASRAYAQLGLDWPDYMRQIDPARETALDQVGATLEAATRHISTIETPNGPQGNTALFAGVGAYYRGKLAQLDNLIQQFETSPSGPLVVLTDSQHLARTDPFDLWGGIDQPLTFQAPEISTMTCGGADAPLPTPGNFKGFVPNFNRYNLAEYLRVGTSKVCLSAAPFLLNLQKPTPQCPTPPPNPDGLLCPIGNLPITVTLYVNGVNVSTATWTSSFKVQLGREQSPEGYAFAHWDTLKGWFESQSTLVPPSPALVAQREDLLAAITTAVQDRLRLYQQSVYGQVLNQVQSATTLHTAAVELAGGKALLDGYITLGLPRAVANDDFLRSLLFGSQRLVDDGVVAETYALAISDTNAITTTQFLTDTRVALSQVALQRANALDDMLKQYLDAIGTGTHTEELALAADTRIELRVSQRLARLATGALGHGAVFLPMIQR